MAAGLLIALYLGVSLYQLMRANSLFEAAQQQRILNQRYAKEVLLSASGVPVGHEKTAREWERTIDLLSSGGPLTAEEPSGGQRVQPPVDAKRFRADLERLSGLRKSVIEESTRFLRSATLDRHREDLFDELYRQSLELQAAGDALVNAYDKHLDSGVSWWDVNAVAVELAERQRMLIQQHIKEVLFVAHGIPADYQATRLRIYESFKILAEGGSISIDNKDAITIPAPGSEDIRFNLDQQKQAIDRFTAVSNQYLMLANESVERSIQLKRISDLTADFHEAATALLGNYRKYYEARVHRAAREAFGAALAVLVFALLLTWAFLRKYIDAPIRSMTASLRAVREGGKMPASAAVSEPGPVGDLGRELDRCVRQWESRQEWFDRFLSARDSDELEDPGAQDPVASRVYQWYKSRGGEPVSPRRQSPRWDSERGSGEEDITIIGRLPETEGLGSPVISDSELLDQLIHRANELRGQHEELTRAHDRLSHEVEALRSAETRLQDSEAYLRAENVALRQTGESLSSQLRDQVDEIARLRAQIDSLRHSGERSAATREEIDRANQDLVDRLAQQAEAVRSLREELTMKSHALDAAIEAADRAERDHEIEISGMRRGLDEAASARMDAERERKEWAERARAQQETLLDLNRKLAAAEAEIHELKGNLERTLLELRETSQGREQVFRRAEALEAELSASEQARQTERASGLEVLAEARRQHEEALRVLSSAKAEIDAVSAQRLERIASQERMIAEGQEALARQTRILELLRAEFADAVSRHQIELDQRDQAVRQGEEALSGLRSRYEAAAASLEASESELWKTRKELSERHQELNAARVEIDRLRRTEMDQASLIASMREDLSRLQAAMDSKTRSLDEMIAIRRTLEDKISMTESAFRDKSQALISAEERLTATRTALKATLEELQERSKH